MKNVLSTVYVQTIRRALGKLWNNAAVRRVFKYLFVYYLFVRPFLVCLLMIPGPWGPSVKGRLPEGSEIEFRRRGVGRETDDQMNLTTPDGSSTVYRVNCTHASNLHYVTIRYLSKPSLVYIEAYGKPVSTLFLDTGEFFPEGVRPPPEVTSDVSKRESITIARGRTWSLLQVFWPL